MKKHIWMIVILVVCGLTPKISLAQTNVVKGDSTTTTDPDFYLSMEQISDLLKWLPAPPDTTDEAFVHDIMRYFWGKTQRQNRERANMAISDAVFNMNGVCETFSEPFGLPISKEKTPEIYKLLEHGLNTIDLICVLPKEHYMRKRPFDRMKEPSLIPKDERMLSLDGSYPSAHAIRGWGAALLMVEINPDAADALFARGLMYGESRVIAGVHWQSDVDAGRLSASAACALLHTSKEFITQMAKAQEEFRKMKGI